MLTTLAAHVALLAVGEVEQAVAAHVAGRTAIVSLHVQWAVKESTIIDYSIRGEFRRQGAAQREAVERRSRAAAPDFREVSWNSEFRGLFGYNPEGRPAIDPFRTPGVKATRAPLDDQIARQRGSEFLRTWLLELPLPSPSAGALPLEEFHRKFNFKVAERSASAIVLETVFPVAEGRPKELRYRATLDPAHGHLVSRYEVASSPFDGPEESRPPDAVHYHLQIDKFQSSDDGAWLPVEATLCGRSGHMNAETREPVVVRDCTKFVVLKAEINRPLASADLDVAFPDGSLVQVRPAVKGFHPQEIWRGGAVVERAETPEEWEAMKSRHGSLTAGLLSAEVPAAGTWPWIVGAAVLLASGVWTVRRLRRASNNLMGPRRDTHQ